MYLSYRLSKVDQMVCFSTLSQRESDSHSTLVDKTPILVRWKRVCMKNSVTVDSSLVFQRSFLSRLVDRLEKDNLWTYFQPIRGSPTYEPVGLQVQPRL